MPVYAESSSVTVSGLRATWHVAVHASLHHRHFPFGPRGSTVSGRHLHATYGDFTTTFASASFSFVCRACSCSHAWRVATAPRGVHSARLGPQPHDVASHVCSHNTHAHSAEADVARVSRQQSVASGMWR